MANNGIVGVRGKVLPRGSAFCVFAAVFYGGGWRFVFAFILVRSAVRRRVRFL
jgi:hypothetical protein